MFAAGSRVVRQLEDSSDVGLGDAAIAYSLAELASDMYPSDSTLGFLHRMAIYLDPVALGGPSFHLAFECRMLDRSVAPVGSASLRDSSRAVYCA